jgi:hypothetical protein
MKGIREGREGDNNTHRIYMGRNRLRIGMRKKSFPVEFKRASTLVKCINIGIILIFRTGNNKYEFTFPQAEIEKNTD